MKKIAVFASGNGSNFQAIADEVAAGSLRASLELLVCDKPGAFVLERAKKSGIHPFVFSPKEFSDKTSFEKIILEKLKAAEVEYIVLAGYMRLIGSVLLQAYEGRIVNIHPSLLPAFPGKDAIGQAIEAKAKLSGVTVHLVDEGMDTGPILAQHPIEIVENETKESLQDKIHRVEHQFYPMVLEKLLNA